MHPIKKDTHIEGDTLIIGSGISGLICALVLARNPKREIYLLTKSRLKESNTRYAQGGIALSIGTKKEIAAHIIDTLTAGHHLNKASAVRRIIEKSSDIMKILHDIDVRFDAQPTREGGHGISRVYHTKDTTGASLEFYLTKAIKKHKNIRIYTHTFATELLMNGKRCIGCRGTHRKKEHLFLAQQTVLATGGVGQLYEYTTNPKGATGDGIALAAEKGARMRHMEFIQFHPTALKENGSPLLLLSEALRGEGACLVNKNGKRFMETYDPRKELAPRDIVTKAIVQEQKKGKVFLDFRHQTETWIRNRFPMLTREIQQRTGKKLWKDLIEITPAAHYLCGGIVVDAHGRTSIHGLYAIGETAETGLHGANRLASNSLLEGAAYGLFVAEDIEKGKKTKEKQKILIQKAKNRKMQKITPISQKTIRTMRKNIQEILWTGAGIVRNKKDLQKTMTRLKSLQQKIPKEKTLSPELEEVRHMILCGLLIAESAIKRKKSIGCHWRSDSD